jgi:hypothetical protein
MQLVLRIALKPISNTFTMKGGAPYRRPFLTAPGMKAHGLVKGSLQFITEAVRFLSTYARFM